MNNQGLEDQALLLETFGAKVDEEAHSELGSFQIIDYLGNMGAGKIIYCFKL